MNKKRFRQLLESSLGNVKPLLYENKLKDERFLTKKNDLLDYLYTIGLEQNPDGQFADINNDGKEDMEMFSFNKGNVEIYAGVAFFSNGDIKYLIIVKTKPNKEIVVPVTFVDNLEEFKTKIEPFIEQSYEDTKLEYLGVENEKEYQPSKDEYNDLLNRAIDNEDWKEAKRLQDKYGHIYK